MRSRSVEPIGKRGESGHGPPAPVASRRRAGTGRPGDPPIERGGSSRLRIARASGARARRGRRPEPPRAHRCERRSHPARAGRGGSSPAGARRPPPRDRRAGAERTRPWPPFREEEASRATKSASPCRKPELRRRVVIPVPCDNTRTCPTLNLRRPWLPGKEGSPQERIPLGGFRGRRTASSRHGEIQALRGAPRSWTNPCVPRRALFRERARPGRRNPRPRKNRRPPSPLAARAGRRAPGTTYGSALANAQPRTASASPHRSLLVAM
jgi:hypothetical protein